MAVPDNYSIGCSLPSIELSTESPMEELEKGPKELKGSEPHRRINNMNQPVPPELPGTKPPTKVYTRLQPHM